jgi:penicillin-binding protein 1B
MIQSPARYAPDRHPEEAKARRDLVIAAMIQDGAINQETAQSVSQAPLTVAKFESDANEFAPYYIDSVNRAVETVPVSLSPEAEDPEEAEFEHNLRVQTTIDPDLQAAAENALRHQLDRLSKTRPGQSQPQGAMVALDVHTGDVLAMVGGRNYADSQLNRATDARRQPGSVFKPFVYAAAFESGISPLTVVRDEPRTFHYGTATYAPANYGGAYSMHEVLLRDGLVRSLNVVTVDLAMRIGLIKVADTASRMGLPRPDSYPSMALGTFEVTPLQVAAAYAAFANGGRPVEPRFVKGSVDDAEVTMPADSSEQRQVLRATTAYMITDALSDVIERGTASRAKGSFRNVAIAGKTGTSRDGWFVGYTPNLVCVVWVGFDDNEQLGMTGAEAALPAWVDFMKEALAVRPSLGGSAFPKPGSILTVKVDPESGALAGPNCPSAQTVSVDSRFSPALECYVHRLDYDDEIMLSDYSGENLFEDRDRVNSATESDDFDDETPDASTQSDRDLRESVSKPKRRTTRTEVNDRGQARLVTDPTAAIHTAKRPASPTQYRPQ